ncbi:MAG: S8 family serine peptidase [Bacteroidaceae bacterium]|nr:S8 family serine peptidase [Bacteroidaceae bacterium]
MMSKFTCLLCLLMCVSTVRAKTDYYYYKEKRIPLIENDNKVCVSIYKDNKNAVKRLLGKVKVVEQIKDETFDIFIVSRSAYENLTFSDSWEKDAKSVLLTPSYKTSNNTEVFLTPYLNLRLKKEEDIDILRSYAQDLGLEIIRQDPLMPLWYILSITSETGKNALEIANALWESGKFAASVPDLCSNDLLCSNDPMFNQQWGLHNNVYTDIDISVCTAWNYATGKNIKIAILDQGVDLSHIDLAAHISNLSYDTETNSSPSIVHGDHATHCAGIAAAIKDNGIQIAGVAPEATIVSISNSLAVTTNSRLKRADGIVWAYQNGVDIISNSWLSSTQHSAIDEAIHDAFKYGRHGKGCVIVFASGNGYSNNVSYPANCNDTILAVGSINNTGMRAPSSNYGTALDIVAPGVNILSTLPNDTVGYDSGTSMACPHVAGVAALILERNSELTVNQVNSIIHSNAKKLPGVNFNVTKPDGFWNNEYGYGLVDAYSSVINTPGTVYIQNDTITGSRVISADSIYVGRDVTNTQAYGDVMLGQGDITMKARYVEFKNSTTVPLGTTLKIGN